MDPILIQTRGKTPQANSFLDFPSPELGLNQYGLQKLKYMLGVVMCSFNPSTGSRGRIANKKLKLVSFHNLLLITREDLSFCGPLVTSLIAATAWLPLRGKNRGSTPLERERVHSRREGSIPRQSLAMPGGCTQACPSSVQLESLENSCRIAG